MAWTAPMTAVTGNSFTAAQFNTYVRDNLLETAPAKSTTAGSLFVSQGSNTIVQRTPVAAFVSTRESRSNSSYGGLSTPGPAVTVTTGTSAIIMIEAQLSVNATDNTEAIAAWAVSGATTVAANDDYCLKAEGQDSVSREFRFGTAHLYTGLTAGSNTFTMQYRSGTHASQVFFERRRISVIPL